MNILECLALIACLAAPQDTAPPPQIDLAWSHPIAAAQDVEVADRVPVSVLVDR